MPNAGAFAHINYAGLGFSEHQTQHPGQGSWWQSLESARAHALEKQQKSEGQGFDLGHVYTGQYGKQKGTLMYCSLCLFYQI